MNGTELLIIFTKAPIAGMVKTRLFPHLSFDEAAELQAAFLYDIVALALGSTARKTCLAYTPSASLGVMRELFPRSDIEFLAQEGDDLGERMHNAFQCAFEKGFTKAVIIGSDIPTMPSGHIEKAFGALDNSDICICPTEDGGYCMLGLKRPAPELFRDIDWSNRTVLTDTLARANGLGLSVTVLDALPDVDTFEDLLGLKGTDLPANTERVLARLRPRLDGENGWLV